MSFYLGLLFARAAAPVPMVASPPSNGVIAGVMPVIVLNSLCGLSGKYNLCNNALLSDVRFKIFFSSVKSSVDARYIKYNKKYQQAEGKYKT